MKHLMTLCLIVISCSLFAQDHRPEIHCKHFFHGYPYGTPATNDLIIRDIYALSNNDSTKFADWVTYRLTMREIDGDLTIERNWKADPWLEENETLEPSSPDDYEKANSKLKTDRGHLAPLASFKGSIYASHTNYLSNITPQAFDLNRGVWLKLENKVRDLVSSCHEVYVMTGPLYERSMRSLPRSDEPHRIPSGYWKIICIEQSNEIESAAFIFDQETPRNDKVIDHSVTIDEIERRTGLDFLWQLEDSKEISIESTMHTAFLEMYFKD